ncbi:MAG: multidrug effflux MFS transporter [Betaproteobacteria bacterium]|jgi:DHA1 family bicyclomycin/chloramphenicol resistance-like MFS transporter|nr:multidrug effflux MFS transporter [Betaproteobacteria bacterium]
MTERQPSVPPISLPALAAILAALAMIGPFTIDTYLPSFPYIAAEFSATPAQLQQTLSLYLFASALMTLFHGTLSDSFGRRPVILCSLVAYILASAGCALASSLPQLLFWRVVQGLAAGAGIIVGRAIIRDSREGHEAQKLMSWVTMIFGIAPAVAPVIGGWLQGIAGWRLIFWFLAAFGACLLAATLLRLPETHAVAARQPFRAAVLMRNYWRLGRDARLVLLCLTIAFNFSGFFLYVVSAPAVIYDLLGLGETDFAWLFVPGIGGVMIGAYLSGRTARATSPVRAVGIGYAVMTAAALLNIVYCANWPPALPWTVLPVMLYTIGMAFAMPSASLLALDLFPRLRGMTSSLQGFAHSLFAGLTAGLVSPLVSATAPGLAAAMGGLLCSGAASWCAYRLVAARPFGEPT